MNTEQILSDLRAERDRIDQAIQALESLNLTGSTTIRRLGRPKAATSFEFGANQPQPPRRGRRRMSAAARKRISEAAKARWAARRKTTAPMKSAAKKAAPARRGMSAAARKKLSALMKARWTARKKAAKA